MVKDIISINIPIQIFVDKYTKSYVVYSKKYDISGYGETKEKAINMFNLSVLEILSYTKPSSYYKRNKKVKS